MSNKIKTKKSINDSIRIGFIPVWLSVVLMFSFIGGCVEGGFSCVQGAAWAGETAGTFAGETVKVFTNITKNK